jgi:lysine 2,3-aminomutase
MTFVPKTLRDPPALAAEGLIPRDKLAELEQVAARYAVSVTPAMAELIDPAAAGDPIARQFLPDVRELETTAGERADPIGDDSHSPVPGIVHRYPDRVLLKLATLCPVYCRFCFRRETVGPAQGAVLAPEALETAVGYIRDHEKIWEVILTGGDPFILSPRRIGEVTALLRQLPHVKVLRWHTRVPVVAPERVTDELVAALESGGQAVYVALHANHPRELTADARAACARIVDAGIPLVSQTVLLKGVNDDPDALAALMRAFVECRVKPYYLHHGDLAPGTSHFRTTIGEGQALVRSLRGRLSGLCQPTYVLDIPGGHGKVPIGPGYLHLDGQDGGAARYLVEDVHGERHAYCDGACRLPGRSVAEPSGERDSVPSPCSSSRTGRGLG